MTFRMEGMSDLAPQTPQLLRAPKLFWQTRRLDGHRNWPFAFWRELFQNSVDAGAKEIDIRMGTEPRIGSFGRPSNGGSIIRVVFADDGVGMTEDTIRNVFLEPGRSTKSTGTSVGGFGTARTLLCFSQDRYEIHTNGLVVEGDGSEYILERAAEAAARAGDPTFRERSLSFAGRQGCVFVMDVDPEETEYSWRNVSEDKLRQELFNFVDLSQLDLRAVRLNGGLLEGGLKKAAARTKLSAPGCENFASVHTSQTDKARFKGRVIVRVKGLAMFHESVSSNDTQIILELDPARTKALLTDSRDDLKDGPSWALRSFVQDLTVNRREALHDKTGDKEWTLDGELGDARAEPEPLELVGSKPVPEVLETLAASSAVASKASPVVAVGIESVAGGGDGARVALPGLHDFHMHAENIKGNPVLETAARRWQPKYWRKKGESLAGRGRESHELLAAWTAACSHALGVIGTLRPALLSGRGYIPFVPGFVISASRADADGTTHRLGGLHKILPDERHALLVNPIFDDGSIAYNLRQLRDGEGRFGLQRLVHVAIHEACHVMGRSHDERFANLLTAVSASLDYGKLAGAMLDKINSVRALYGAKEARIQAIEQLGDLRNAIEGALEEPVRRKVRTPRPAGRALAIAHPTALAVMGAVAAPENAAVPAVALRGALEAAIEPQSEVETAIHVQILDKFDADLASVARQGWQPPSVDWSGFDLPQGDVPAMEAVAPGPEYGDTPAIPETAAQGVAADVVVDNARDEPTAIDVAVPVPDEPIGAGDGLDALAIDFAALPELDGLTDRNGAPSEGAVGSAQPASTAEEKAQQPEQHIQDLASENLDDQKFPAMISIYDIIGLDEDGPREGMKDEEGFKP